MEPTPDGPEGAPRRPAFDVPSFDVLRGRTYNPPTLGLLVATGASPGRGFVRLHAQPPASGVSLGRGSLS